MSQIKKSLSLRFPTEEGYLQSCTCVTKVCEHLRSPLDAGSFSRDRQTTLLSTSSPIFPLYFFPNLVFCVLMRLGGCYSYFSSFIFFYVYIFLLSINSWDYWWRWRSIGIKIFVWLKVAGDFLVTIFAFSSWKCDEKFDQALLLIMILIIRKMLVDEGIDWRTNICFFSSSLCSNIFVDKIFYEMRSKF